MHKTMSERPGVGGVDNFTKCSVGRFGTDKKNGIIRSKVL